MTDKSEKNFFMAQANNKKHRRVRLYGKYRAGERTGYNNAPGREVPWLSVNGLWLERAGFSIGDQLEIEVGTCTLIIIKTEGDGTAGD